MLVVRDIVRFIRRKLNLLRGNEVDLAVEIELPLEFHGTSYGGWCIEKDSLDECSTVVSVGVGEDASFDLGLIEKYNCMIYAYDPTPKSIAWVQENIQTDRFRFEPLALSGADGFIKLFLPKNASHVSASVGSNNKHVAGDYFEAESVCLSTLMQRLGVEFVDVLKMDIEGAEYSVLDEALESGALRKVRQLLVEFYHFFSGYGAKDTHNIVDKLRESGFVIAWRSGSCREILFVRQ